MAQYQSPGAAFSSGLEEAMLNQATAKRQAMMDALAAKREDRLAQAELDSMQEHRDKMAEHQQEMVDKAHEQKIAAVEKSTSKLMPGDIPSQENFQQAQDTGLADQLYPKPAPTALGMGIQPGDVGPTTENLPAFRPFIGNPLDRKAAAQKAQEAELGIALGKAPDRPTAVREALRLGVPYGQVDDVVNAYKGKEATVGAKPQSVQEFEYNNAQLIAAGQKPLTYKQYQDEDANRKKVVTPAAEDAALGLSDAGLDMAAKLYQKTGTLPPMGMGKEGAKVRTRVINRASEYDSATDTFHTANGIPDIAGNRSNYQADSAAQAQLTKNLHAVQAFANTAKKNGDLLEDVIKGLPDTGVTWLNQPMRAAATAMGSEQMARFNVLRQSVQTEYARTINNPNLTGVLSDTARKEIEKGLAEGATVGQFKAALKVFAAEAGNRESSLDDEIKGIQKSIRGGPQETPKAKGPVSIEDQRKKYNY